MSKSLNNILVAIRSSGFDVVRDRIKLLSLVTRNSCCHYLEPHNAINNSNEIF